VGGGEGEKVDLCRKVRKGEGKKSVRKENYIIRYSGGGWLGDWAGWFWCKEVSPDSLSVKSIISKTVDGSRRTPGKGGEEGKSPKGQHTTRRLTFKWLGELTQKLFPTTGGFLRNQMGREAEQQFRKKIAKLSLKVITEFKEGVI